MIRNGVAIIGMGCRFPRAESPDELWSLVCNGVEAITEVPPDRWDCRQMWSADSRELELTYARWGGFIEGADRFDAALFGVSDAEAEYMDPQQGMALEAAWHAIEQSGIAPEALEGSQTGVFVGIGNSDFDRRLCSDLTRLDLRAGTGTSYAIVANRVSYVLGLQGPSVAVDTACSSSLVAIHLACRSLLSRETDLALAGGVHIMLSPEKTITLSQGGILSRDGHCKSFSSHADGYVRGEGGGMLLLRRLDDALRERNPILAVIRGSAMNHNGRSNGLSAPLGGAQRALMRRALEVAEIPAQSIGYVEAHATGTRLGDIIEFNALRAVLDEPNCADNPCLISSLKANIGHLEAAAGIAGLIKAALSVREGWIAPILHATPRNPDLRLAGSRLRIADHGERWPHAGPCMRALVNGFSFGGANASVVVEEPPSAVRASDLEARYAAAVLPLSANSDSALRALAGRYAGYFRALSGSKHPAQAFADACFTAQVGRKHFRHRAAIVAHNALDAAAQLDELYLYGRESGCPTRLSDPIELRDLARAYVDGLGVDWAVLARGEECVTDLPKYPFERRCYWRTAPKARPMTAEELKGGSHVASV